MHLHFVLSCFYAYFFFITLSFNYTLFFYETLFFPFLKFYCIFLICKLKIQELGRYLSHSIKEVRDGFHLTLLPSAVKVSHSEFGVKPLASSVMELRGPKPLIDVLINDTFPQVTPENVFL